MSIGPGADADAVRARFARVVRAVADGARATPGGEQVRVGGYTLREAQRRALRAAERAIARFGGVLLADPPGTGKTVLALAIAARTGPRAACVVLAPAALRDQWEAAAARAEVRIAFASLESVSRGRRPPRAPLVIVDEAHHLRAPGTRRHAAVVEACRDATVVLLSATPVVNRAADRDAILSLFLGSRATMLDPATAAQCIVRRREGVVRPAVRRLGAIGRGIDVPGLAEALRTLPPPLPLADDRAAAALVAMSLAMAWRSSLAALDAALRRRVQRGEAMRDLLRDGLVPSQAMLRHWVLHDDATQLALGALLAGPAGGERPHAESVLARHLAAVRALRHLVRPHLEADAARRAAAIIALLAAHPDRRIVVFARHAETIRALHAALRHVPGVVAIVGTQVRAAAGRWSRGEVLRALGPLARPVAANDPRAIRLVLATDVVAEGVEMQGVGVVVHADLPWTPARLAQRLGRVTRVGSAATEVLEGWFAAPAGARALVRLGARLRRKATAGKEALRAARATGALDALLARWESMRPGTTPTRSAHRDGAAAAPFVARLATDRDGFVAVLERGGELQWLSGRLREGRWRVRAAPACALGLLRGAAAAPALAERAAHPRRLLGLIARVMTRRAARALLAEPGTAPDVSASRPAPPPRARRRIERVRTRLARVLERAPALARPALAAAHGRWLGALARPTSLARERYLDALLREVADDAAFARRLGAWLAEADPGDDSSRPDHPGRLVALLVLSGARRPAARPRPGRPAASPGSAAPR